MVYRSYWSDLQNKSGQPKSGLVTLQAIRDCLKPAEIKTDFKTNVSIESVGATTTRCIIP